MSTSKIAQRVAQIKNAIKGLELGFQEISDMSGLSLSTIAPIFKDDWNPKLSTLLALEAGIFGKVKKGKNTVCRKPRSAKA